jgi:hypothetical protein
MKETRTLAHFIWIGEGGLPSFYQQCLNSFAKLHPYWQIKLWTKVDADGVIKNSKYDFYKYDSFINRYNFVKYHVLAQEGGWFVDLDIEWKLSLDQLMFDKVKGNAFPQLFIPVRSQQQTKQISVKDNDDMLIYTEKGLFYELLEYVNQRTGIDLTQRYEPYGPVSLSMWLHNTDYTREYMYEGEIQSNGYYCNHNNGLSWKFV